MVDIYTLHRPTRFGRRPGLYGSRKHTPSPTRAETRPGWGPARRSAGLVRRNAARRSAPPEARANVLFGFDRFARGGERGLVAPLVFKTSGTGVPPSGGFDSCHLR